MSKNIYESLAHIKDNAFLCFRTVHNSYNIPDMDYTFSKYTTKVQQLTDIIAQDITSGKYGEGSYLPSINQLCNSYNVSRDTVFKAFAALREKGLIDSTPGKGYYVINRHKKILLLLDEYSPFKATLYNSFIHHLPKSHQVDLWFHQYNERFFNGILRDAAGKYNYYVIMNFDNEKVSPLISKIPSAKLLMLDFGCFKEEKFSYLCQDFGKGFHDTLCQLKERFGKYKKNIFFFPAESKHPRISISSFRDFCAECHQEAEVIECQDELKVEKGNAYLVIRQIDVVDIIKQSRQQGLQCGKDFGLVVYNDSPAYEVIDNGITALTIDWEAMGKMAAKFIVNGESIQQYLPTEIHLRQSL